MTRHPGMDEAAAELAAWRKIQPLSPCIDQTPAQIENYYRNAPIGAVAVVRRTQYRNLEYTVSEIDRRNTRSGRIGVKGFGDFYMKSGSNCFHPTGQTTLVVPTEEVLAWAAEHPRGEFGVSVHRFGTEPR